MNNFEGKVALITGGNSGIGYATAKELKEQGATVIITGRRPEAVTTAANELSVIGKIADQANLQDIEKLAHEVASEYGKIDVLFINAGVSGKANIAEATEEFWDQVVNVNLKGAYFTLSRFIPILNDGAAVVFLSSIVAGKKLPGSSVYSLSKAAINSVVKTAALELAPRKIRVNAVSPGPTATAIFDKMGLDQAKMDGLKNALQQKIPLAQLGDPNDIAKMVIHLASPASKFITGADVLMDGGLILT